MEWGKSKWKKWGKNGSEKPFRKSPCRNAWSAIPLVRRLTTNHELEHKLSNHRGHVQFSCIAWFWYFSSCSLCSACWQLTLTNSLTLSSSTTFHACECVCLMPMLSFDAYSGSAHTAATQCSCIYMYISLDKQIHSEPRRVTRFGRMYLYYNYKCERSLSVYRLTQTHTHAREKRESNPMTCARCGKCDTKFFFEWNRISLGMIVVILCHCVGSRLSVGRDCEASAHI